jgi:hypothetical protein
MASNDLNITFENAGTYDGVTEWWIKIDGLDVGEMSRERPMKWHGNGVSGLVRDRESPWLWCATVLERRIEIPEGSSVREAKRLITEAAK